SQELVAPGRAPINPCAAVLCAAPSTCEVVDGQGVCIALDSCARVRCPGGTSCEVVDGNAECLPDPDPNPCAAVSCLAPSTCELVRGEPVCVPVEEPNPCAAVSCLAPSTCEVIDGQGVCIALDACASVRCRAGTHCEVVGDRAVCERDEATNPCAAVSCLAPSTCEVIDGQGVCVPVGPFCGGFGGFACPGSGLCVDAPGDGCDPDNGGADCGGVCTCPIRALCIQGLVFDESPEVCACVPAEPAEPAPFCGGIAALPCPGAGVCADAPGDGCNPDDGGADCGGVCTCLIRALCIQGLVFDASPEVCACVPAGEGGECRE
ncbi:MAG: hypothetical protein RL033_5850, partial [Pseudomonadota bacterium]